MQKLLKVFYRSKKPAVKLATEIEKVHPRESFVDALLKANEKFVDAIMASMGVDMKRR